MSQLKTPAGRPYAPIDISVVGNKEQMVKTRGRYMFPSLRTSYQTPALLVSARGAYMYDEQGNEYLDAYNNIPHVGHCHPLVVEAARSQVGQIVSNTRYLHPSVTELSEQIVRRLPSPLSVVMFTNSGSEANDLAMRIARGYTARKNKEKDLQNGGKKRRGVICLEGAYHGTTTDCCKISPHPYYAEGRDEVDLSDVEVAPQPCEYRGLYRRGEVPDAEIASKYASHVQKSVENLAQRGYSLSAFIAETVQGCGGQIVYPKGYLAQVCDIVHRNGGLYIADEVQVGFGRCGSHFWSFEREGFIPDILTTGKSFGNGLPLAAVITTLEIAESFNGHEYFSSVAGNPVSSVVGLAVLKAIDEDRLVSNADSVGSYLLSEMSKLAAKHRIVGDVRGVGLFLGMELVKDRVTKEPAPKEAKFVQEYLYSKRILTGVLGIHDNVVRIKPPMCFSRQNADRLIFELDTALTRATAGQSKL